MPGAGALRHTTNSHPKGQISREPLDQALLRQRRADRRPGEELLAVGDLKPQQLEGAISFRQKLVSAALAAALSMAVISPPRASAAGTRHASATLAVTATVVVNARVQWVRQPSRLQISAADISRGYVELPGASVLEVKTNSKKGVIFTFNNMAEFVTSINVAGLGNEVELGSEGGEVAEDFSWDDIRNRKLTVGYRLRLSPDTQPGTYIWPLLVSVRPL